MGERNSDLKQLARQKGVRLWRIAEQLGLNDGNFSRLLRYELNEEKREQIRDIIFNLANEEDSNETND